MPRDIPVGNGQLLVTYDQHYQIRDLYFPHVGQDNHAGPGPCRFGVWADLPGNGHDDQDRRSQRLMWSNQGWETSLAYEKDTLVTDVKMTHDQLGLSLQCCDAVDFHRPVMVRKIQITNHADHRRTVHLFHHQDFNLFGTKVGDTAYFDPQLQSLIHYRQKRYLMASFCDAQGLSRISEYATGTAGFRGAEGTWRDSEDGHLGNNPIAQGAVDSTMMAKVTLEARGSEVIYMVIAAGFSLEDMATLHAFVQREKPQGVIDRTRSYWQLWLTANRCQFPTEQAGGLPDQIIDLFNRSLLVLRTQIDNGGAIIAANDSDIMQFARDTYSYLWPRDGALVAAGLDAAGFPDVARSFYSFCAKIISEQGYFLHKYNPDGSPASSWHPWINQKEASLPIQEDETALVVWALWRHYQRYRDIEFIRPIWVDLVKKAGDFMVRFRDPDTHLPLPSYDLWEERHGIHAFTVATVYGGLIAAQNFAQCFGDTQRQESYGLAAAQMKDAFCKHMWSDEHQRFLRRIEPTDHQRTAGFMAQVIDQRTPQPTSPDANIQVTYKQDTVLDSAMYAIFAFDLLDVNDPRVEKTMSAIEQRLWVKTPVGGLARYEDDYYHAVSKDIHNIPGNPWFICTLWLAQWKIAKAKTVDQLRLALPIFQWVANHSLHSGVLAEQVHPLTNVPLSVSPLTWSHATVVSTVEAYLHKLGAMTHCPTCGQDTSGTDVPGCEHDAA